MKKCTKTYFTREILCAGSMTDYLTIKRREIQGTTVNSIQANENFTIVASYMGKLENRNPVQRFDGVVIPNEITDIAYIPFEQVVYELDYNTLYLEIEEERNRLFKLKSIVKYDNYLALFLRETGFVGLEATK